MSAEAPELLEFRDWFGECEVELRNLVRDGKLPADILLRMMQIGQYEPDPASPDEFRSLYWKTLDDAVQHAETPSSMQPETLRVVYGESPHTITDLEGSWNEEAYEQLGQQFSLLYWSRGSLTKVILGRRAAEGKTITKVPPESYWLPEEVEQHRCRGLAQGVWRTLVRRLRPDIIENPHWFYSSTQFSFNTCYELGERTIRRRAIGHTRIEDETMRGLYDEIEAIGMKGIGPVGKRDLAAMLAPEHPDIMEKLAKEEGLSFEPLDE